MSLKSLLGNFKRLTYLGHKKLPGPLKKYLLPRLKSTKYIYFKTDIFKKTENTK